MLFFGVIWNTEICVENNNLHACVHYISIRSSQDEILVCTVLVYLDMLRNTIL